MTVATPDAAALHGVAELVDRLRAEQLPPPAERRKIRDAVGATLQDVADAIGVEKMTASRYERGLRKPRGRRLAAYICLLEALAEIAKQRAETQAQK